VSKEIVKVPDIGGAEDVEVIEICVAPGDRVEKEQSLIVLESDKASMEIPSPMAGTVLSVKVSEGDMVAEGAPILEIELADADDDQAEKSPDASAESEAIESTAVESTTVESTAAESEPEQELKTDTQQASVDSPTAGQKPKTQSATFIQDVVVPDIGGAEGVEVIELYVAKGDVVTEGQSLIVLESDKASMEIPSPDSGVVKEIRVAEGSKVNEGDIILLLESSQSTADISETAPASGHENLSSLDEQDSSSTSESMTSMITAPKQEVVESFVAKIADSKPSKEVYAGPAVRILARELGVDLGLVNGSGPKARILKDDVQRYVKSAMQKKPAGAELGSGMGIPSIPEVDFSLFGEIATEKMSRMQRITATNMHRSWLNVPHVTQFDDVDITELEEFRAGLKNEAENRGVKITPIPFLLKACAKALQENPAFNASLAADGEHIIYKKYVHIGMAVDTPAGLMVPVIRDVDKKTIWDLAAESAELAQKARERKLTADEMRGGCFTISSLGGIGGKGFTPVVNTPEVGILGVSRLSVKPLWNGSEFVPRKMLPLCLSYDHRAVNGGDAGRFLTLLGELLADIRRLVL
jgi:pyruvate dehydrogenase E2 component (dihydrolipoamide acetyltransferase)